MIELIVPPSPYLGDDTRNPPLGLLYVAAVMEKSGYEVRVTDLRGKKDFQIGDADIYGITATSPDYPMSVRIARIIKAKNPQSWVVLGGVHGSAVPRQIDPMFDKIVVGEGELAFWRVARDFYANKRGQRIYSGPWVKDLDSIPFPARHLLSDEMRFSRHALSVDGELAGTLISSRGCPNSCAFCASNIMWHKKVRFRSPQNVEAELVHMIQKYGVRKFRFQDDTITLNHRRLKELCELLSPLGIQWRANARVDDSSLEILRMLQQAGCEELGYGIESLSQHVLNRCNKGTTLEDIYLALSNVKALGMKCRLFFIIGLPGEPPGFADRLETFLDNFDPDEVVVSTFVPYPGTDVFRHPERFGIKLKDAPLDQFLMTLGLKGDEPNQPPIFVHDVLSDEQIIEERAHALEIIKCKNMNKNL